jgi:peptidoglycan/LPS O-acetylase OafA/YrhL
MVADVPTGAPPGRRAGEGYRPHLDGLRAVAVYLVILFHAGLTRFSGGFIGVDIFFVLSGYLVTQLLMRDLLSRGSIRFARFYARRMRRLLPASFVALVITAVVYSAVASKADTASAVNAFKAAFLYVANWFFIRRSSDYFATNINTNPVVHFWSLAVEEQFYFLWPILLATLFALTRRFQRHAQRAMQIAVATGALISVVWALKLSSYNLNRAYYGTDTRAYQLLAGAFLALSPGIVRRASAYKASVVAAPLALVVLLGLSTSFSSMNAIHRGIATTITTAVLIVAIESARGEGPANQLLSSRPMVYLGQISYGTYLWHWPVIVVAVAISSKTISPLSTFAISALVATGIASLSYHLLERPIREHRFLDTISPGVVAFGLTVAIVAALVIVPQVLDPYRAHATTAAPVATNAGFTPVPDLDFANVLALPSSLDGIHFTKGWNCEHEPTASCAVMKGSGPRILVIGDSHANMFIWAFAKLAQIQHVRLYKSASPGCPWQRDLYIPEDNIGNDNTYTRNCIAFKTDLYTRVIPQLKPDLIVAISNDYLSKSRGAIFNKNNQPVHSDGPAQFKDMIAADTAQSVKTLRESAANVMIFDPVPTAPNNINPFTCLTKSKFLEDCRFVANLTPTPLDVVYGHLADNKHVYVANVDKLLCPYMPICDPVINGVIVRKDHEHITTAFAVSLAPALTTLLQGDGLIPGG